MAELMQKDKRRYSRIPFDAQVRLLHDNKALDCHLIDISIKGALIELLPPNEHYNIDVNQEAQLELILWEEEVAIHMSAQVAHHNNTHIGLSCESIDSESISHLRRILELNAGDPDLFNRELLQLGA
ncbi:MAG: PilZ domain-containing protein [Gammaproteobacteria bacterium]|nr:PilZ domain-containing protein [Gammaproteobacteria bacterium]